MYETTSLKEVEGKGVYLNKLGKEQGLRQKELYANTVLQLKNLFYMGIWFSSSETTIYGIQEQNNEVSGWWEPGFLLLVWEVTEKQGEETRLIHAVSGVTLEMSKSSPVQLNIETDGYRAIFIEMCIFTGQCATIYYLNLLAERTQTQ